MPMAALSAAALALFSAKTFKTLLLYPQKVRSGVIGALMASIAGLALTHTVAKAVVAGVFTSGKPFLRTPKCEDPALLSQVLRVAWQETTLFWLCVLAIVSVGLVHGFDDPAGAAVDVHADRAERALSRDRGDGMHQRGVQCGANPSGSGA